MSHVAVISAVSVRSAVADHIGFAVDAIGSLYIVDLTTDTTTPIGSTGQLPEGFAISPQGSLFGTDLFGNLFSVSRTTGASTLIGNTGVGDIEGLSFNGTTLIGTNFSNLGGPTTVYAVNTSTAVPTAVTSFSRGPVRAMAVVTRTRSGLDHPPLRRARAKQALVLMAALGLIGLRAWQRVGGLGAKLDGATDVCPTE